MKKSVILSIGICPILFWIGLLSVNGQKKDVAYEQYLADLYKKIDQVQNTQTVLDIYRKESDYFRHLMFSYQNDTIYMIEVSNIGEEYYGFTIWNKTDTLSGNLNSISKKWYTTRPFFVTQKMKLVSEWDKKEILSESRKYPSTDLNRLRLIATQIIFKNGKYKIDSFQFLDFEKEGRDDIESIPAMRKNERADKMPPQKH